MISFKPFLRLHNFLIIIYPTIFMHAQKYFSWLITKTVKSFPVVALFFLTFIAPVQSIILPVPQTAPSFLKKFCS